jgi:hypothetical protein
VTTLINGGALLRHSRALLAGIRRPTDTICQPQFWMPDTLLRHSGMTCHEGRNVTPSYVIVQAKLAEIEAELKRIGFWQDTPLKPEQYHF